MECETNNPLVLFNTELYKMPSEIRILTETVLCSVPFTIWEKIAGMYHHPQPDREKFGMLYHTKSVIGVCNILIDIYDIKGDTKYKLISSAILHDICKFGKDTMAPKILKEHPYLAGELIRELDNVLNREEVIDIAIAVEDHTGRWSEKPIRNTQLGKLLHIADMIASRENVSIEWKL